MTEFKIPTGFLFPQVSEPCDNLIFGEDFCVEMVLPKQTIFTSKMTMITLVAYASHTLLSLNGVS
jgi:hypothetical protein